MSSSRRLDTELPRAKRLSEATIPKWRALHFNDSLFKIELYKNRIASRSTSRLSPLPPGTDSMATSGTSSSTTSPTA